MLLRELVMAGCAQSVEDGAAAVHAKIVVGGYVGQKLLADGAFQVDQLTAGLAFEVKMASAISRSHVLVDVGGLGIAAIFPHRPLGAQLRQMAVQGAFALLLSLGLLQAIQLLRQLVHAELAIRVALQKAQKPLSAGRFIGFSHGNPPFRATERVVPRAQILNISVYHTCLILSINLRMILKLYEIYLFLSRKIDKKCKNHKISLTMILRIWYNLGRSFPENSNHNERKNTFMKMHRILAILMAATLLFGTFCACG